MFHRSSPGKSPKAVVALLIVLLATFAGAPSSSAQSARGRLIGTILDPDGKAVSGAVVTATNAATGQTRTATSSGSGTFAIVELEPGSHDVTIEGSGFKRATASIEVAVGRDTSLDVTLEVGGVNESVTVEAGTPLLNATTTETGGTLSQKALTELPLNGRDFQDLLGLFPGFQRQPGGGFGSTNVNGQRATSSSFQVDGISNNDNYSGTVAQGQEGVFVKTGGFLPVDAIQEFTVSANPSAQYGQKAGGHVNVALKSGSNEFHGTLYEFFRNDVVDARAFFNEADQPQNPLRFNQFGFTIGGPIVKDKLFFFGNYEGQRVRQAESYIVFTPGLNSILDALPDGGIDALSARILPLFPAGDDNDQAIVSIPSFSDIDNVIYKMDWVVNERNTINGRYLLGNTDQTEVDSFYLRPEYAANNDQRSQLVGLAWTSSLRPAIVNEVRFGYTRLYQAITPVDGDVNPADIGFVTGVTDPTRFGFPRIRITGYDTLGGRLTNLISDPSETYTIVDNVSLTLGRHNVKFGGEYRYDRALNTRDIAARGEFRFRSLGDFLEGRVDRASILTGSTTRDIRQNNVSFYVQDDFKLTPNLTVNAGLRWEYFGVISESDDLLANFIPGRGLVQVGAGLDRPYDRDPNNFAPRVGFAWDVTGDGKTVVRGNYGIYYDQPALSAFIGQNGNVNAITSTLGLNFNPVGGVQSYVIRPRGSAINWALGEQIFPNFDIPTSFLDVLGFDEQLRTPYAHEYSLNIQREVWTGGVLEVGFVGTKGTRLYQLRDINQIYDVDRESRPFDFQFVDEFGDPMFQYVNYVTSDGNANFNSLQVRFQQRNVKGFTSLVGYTYGKSIDAASTNRPINPQNSLNVGAERARSDYDVQHRFTGSFTYDIPTLEGLPRVLGEGWAVNGILTLQTGRPVDVYYGDDVSGFYEYNDRPNVIGDISRIEFRPGQPIDPDVLDTIFEMPAFGTFGSAGRNILQEPGYQNFDFSVTKRTEISDRFTLQFRAEFFNIANHPNFARPRGDLFSDNFGAQTDSADRGNPLGSGGPRRIQFALKLIF